MAVKKSGLNTLSYLGVSAPTPPQFVSFNRAPTINDYLNFEIGTLWLNTAANNPPLSSDVYILVAKFNPGTNSKEGIWVRFMGSSGDVDFLQGDTGAAVGPSGAGIINLASGVPNMSVDGNPGTFTLTLNSSGGAGFLETLTGDNGGAVGPDANGNINVTAMDGAINSGTTVHFDGNPGSNKIVLDISDTTLNNIFLGSNSGNLTLTGTGNTGLGINSFSSLTSGIENSSFGYLSLVSVDSGGRNSSFGMAALFDLTTGSFNTAVGWQAGSNLATGSDNILIGQAAGISYTTSESDNILIGSLGVITDSGTIRIGASGTHTSTFISGIASVAISNRLPVFIDSTTGELGTQALSQGVVLADSAGDFTSTTGTDGQVVIGATGGAPAFATLTSGDGSISFTPGANTLDMTAVSAALTFHTDSTDATVSANAITIKGGTNVTTSGAGAIVTIDATPGAVSLNFNGDLGTANPTANTIIMEGGTNIDTSASGNIVTFNATMSYTTLSFESDSGTANPSVGNIIKILGGTNATTSATSNEVTVNASMDFSGLSFSTNSGTANPTAGVIQIVGGTGITVTGTGNTVTVGETGSHFTYTPIDATDSPYDATDDEYISVDTSTGAVTVRLPDVAALVSTFIIKDRTGNASTGNITVTTVSGATNIDGATTFVMNTDFEAVNILGNGSTYEVY